MGELDGRGLHGLLSGHLGEEAASGLLGRLREGRGLEEPSHLWGEAAGGLRQEAACRGCGGRLCGLRFAREPRGLFLTTRYKARINLSTSLVVLEENFLRLVEVAGFDRLPEAGLLPARSCVISEGG